MSSLKDFFSQIFFDDETQENVKKEPENNYFELKKISATEFVEKIQQNPNSNLKNFVENNVAFSDHLEKEYIKEQVIKNEEIVRKVNEQLKKEREKIEKQVYSENKFNPMNEKFNSVIQQYQNKWIYTQGTESYILKGDGTKTAFSYKNPSQWRGDCNDFALEFIKQASRDEKTGVTKEMFKYYQSYRDGTARDCAKNGAWGAAGLYYGAEKLNKSHPNGKILEGKEVVASNLEAGDIICHAPLSKNGIERVKDRYGQIGHIAVVVELNGKKYVQEFASSAKDFRQVELNQYLAEKKTSGYNLKATSLFPDAKDNYEKNLEILVEQRIDKQREKLLAQYGYDKNVEMAKNNLETEQDIYKNLHKQIGEENKQNNENIETQQVRNVDLSKIMPSV